MNNKPLDYGELSNLADLYVHADRSGNFYSAESTDDLAGILNSMVPILDAESRLVCFAPSDKVDLLVRLINSYEPSKPNDGMESIWVPASQTQLVDDGQWPFGETIPDGSCLGPFTPEHFKPTPDVVFAKNATPVLSLLKHPPTD